MKTVVIRGRFMPQLPVTAQFFIRLSQSLGNCFMIARPTLPLVARYVACFRLPATSSEMFSTLF
ncbi:hypothetical protein [Shewanella dokdonensis]|uniref:Uncharacterized protein n=1 Tax=Shewanella dokdonensis TaxID=712036 RepID=A0ABX8DHP0_9GAMM|nr:hypothetical protein [Shewanella dokdonensis]MCL1074180.1 hypothetical protein [Shewanella dokdonensis]QVK23900.1 hypothetical protein KHX94_04400 [Shewanella dokdonensis]